MARRRGGANQYNHQYGIMSEIEDLLSNALRGRIEHGLSPVTSVSRCAAVGVLRRASAGIPYTPVAVLDPRANCSSRSMRFFPSPPSWLKQLILQADDWKEVASPRLDAN